MVIRKLERCEGFRSRLQPLRDAAIYGKRALLRGDLDAFGQAMMENTHAQMALHPRLIGNRAARLIDMAKAHGVTGYKVNGAGGAGGSVTLLLRPGRCERHRLLAEISRRSPGLMNIPVTLAPAGLTSMVRRAPLRIRSAYRFRGIGLQAEPPCRRSSGRWQPWRRQPELPPRLSSGAR
jgi:hypothetical protein